MDRMPALLQATRAMNLAVGALAFAYLYSALGLGSNGSNGSQRGGKQKKAA